MDASLSLELPADLLSSTRMTLDELRLELAIALFKNERLSMGKCAQVAEMPLGEFLTQLAARKIGVHTDAAEAMKDAARIDALFPILA